MITEPYFILHAKKEFEALAAKVFEKFQVNAQKLKEKGITLDTKDGSGNTPLHIAFKKRLSLVVQRYITFIETRGTSPLLVEVRNKEGKTPTEYYFNDKMRDYFGPMGRQIEKSIFDNPIEKAFLDELIKEKGGKENAQQYLRQNPEVLKRLPNPLLLPLYLKDVLMLTNLVKLYTSEDLQYLRQEYESKSPTTNLFYQIPYLYCAEKLEPLLNRYVTLDSSAFLEWFKQWEGDNNELLTNLAKIPELELLKDDPQKFLRFIGRSGSESQNTVVAMYGDKSHIIGQFHS